MSHCTSFKFQYTNRKLIEKSYEDLGLIYKDCDVKTINGIKWRVDEYSLPFGVKRPAIVAKQKGFNYLMEKMGSYYELSVEKHDMTYSDEKTAQRMGNEFQRQYLKNVVLEVMDQMQSNGQNCILDEKANSFEIRFGSFYEKSLLVKIENGHVEERVQGVKGGACQSLTEAMENLLSSSGTDLKTEWTEEYYENSEECLKVYDLKV